MIGTRALRYKKIIEQLDKDDIISVIGCNTCPRLSTTGGEGKMGDLAKSLREDGFEVVDGYLITYPCDDAYYKNIDLSSKVNTIIMLACSSGYANAKYHYPNMKIITAVESRGVISIEVIENEDGTIKRKKKMRRVKV